MTLTAEEEPGLDDEGPAAPLPRRSRRSRHRLRRFVVVPAAVLLVLGSVPLGIGWYLEHQLTSKIGRIDGVFRQLDASERPARPAPGTPGAKAVNILLMGTDRRSDVATTGDDAEAPAWVPGAQRSDTLMLLHLDGSRQAAAVVSIPRDAWVPIPGHGYGKVNWAYSFGGPSLTVATVEQLTGVRIDHLAVVDWTGFAELTDRVGGVDLQVPDTVHDSANDVAWTAGWHHLDGRQALLYVRQRYGLPGGDLDRVKRQQAFLRAVLEASLHQEMRKSPRMLYGFLDTMAGSLSVDSGWSSTEMAKLAFSMRGFRTADLRFLTAPTLGTARIGSQSVVRLDGPAGAELWQDLRTDRIDQWAAVHWRELTGDVVP
ncbi:LCP family protein [Nocardioides sp. CER19]|uniref:LCP family protein n=1 Tax=Nocardioides sp. CER19 TaxID=3038538 RepID=UPI002447CF8E|nr:LCP family protein [Nocardioides sp. CER19]MDH2414807.1 LCP family protein [Nocardioides sp. CER19]